MSKTTSLTYQGSTKPNAMENISTEFCINKNNIFIFTHYKQYRTLNYDNFDLTDLFNLLENDKDAVKLIVESFFTSSKADIEVLNNAFANNDIETLKQTAHKMLPMFRQLKINEIVDKLVLLEQKTTDLSAEEMQNTIAEITEKTPSIIKEIEEVIS